MAIGKKLVLVNPSPLRTGLSFSRSSRFSPLSLAIIASLTPENWEVELVDENYEPFTYRDADLVGITAFSSAAKRAYEIAAVYREQRIPVVMGGIHASALPRGGFAVRRCRGHRRGGVGVAQRPGGRRVEETCKRCIAAVEIVSTISPTLGGTFSTPSTSSPRFRRRGAVRWTATSARSPSSMVADIAGVPRHRCWQNWRRFRRNCCSSWTTTSSATDRTTVSRRWSCFRGWQTEA